MKTVDIPILPEKSYEEFFTDAVHVIKKRRIAARIENVTEIMRVFVCFKSIS
jgi:hypothetical protein